MNQITIAINSALRCTIENTVKRVEVVTDTPDYYGGLGEMNTPVELLTASFGACILSIMGVTARKQGGSIAGSSATVSHVMASEGRSRIAQISVALCVLGAPAEVRESLEAAARACPVHNSLHPDIETTITFEWV